MSDIAICSGNFVHKIGQLRGGNLDLPNGDTIVGLNIRSLPVTIEGYDLRRVERTFDQKGEFQKHVQQQPVVQGDVVVIHLKAVDIRLEVAHAKTMADIKYRRNASRESGVKIINGDTVTFAQTDSESNLKMSAAVLRMDKANLTSQIWRMADNSVVSLTYDQFVDMALAAAQLENDAYARQGVLEASLVAISDLEALITFKDEEVVRGWPAAPEIDITPVE